MLWMLLVGAGVLWLSASVPLAVLVGRTLRVAELDLDARASRRRLPGLTGDDIRNVNRGAWQGPMLRTLW